MAKNTKVALGIGVALLGTVLIVKTVTASGGGWVDSGKFQIGDHITGKDLQPTNVIYVVMGKTSTTYNLAQWFQGEAINEVPGYSKEVIDANYVLVE